MSLLQNSNAVTPSAGYDIDYSMYIGDAPDSTPKLARTLNQTGSTSPKWTFATWYKKGKLTTSGKVLYYFEPKTVAAAATVDLQLTNDESAYFIWSAWSGSSQPYVWTSNGNTGLMLRDYSAWYHICHVVDHSTSPYVWLYLNGVLVDPNIWGTKTGAGYAANYSPVSGDVFKIGSNNSGQLGSGYFADTYWIEQQALAPVGNFGEIDADTGQFVATKYDGPAMTGNSFYLNYSDSSNFGTDSSGLGNNFTATGIAATQQMIDTPQNSTGGNFCTLNPLDLGDNGSWNGALVEGNLSMSGTNGLGKSRSTFALDNTNGSYWEVRWGSATDNNAGISKLAQDNLDTGSKIGADPAYDETGYKGSTGVIDTDGSTEATYATSASGDILGFAYKAGRLYVGKIASADSEATWFNSGAPASGTGYVNATVKTDPTYWAAALNNNHSINFGQDSSFAGEETAQGNTDANGFGDFWGTVPTGFLALCTDNLSDPSIPIPTAHFETIVWTGDGTAGAMSTTGLSFQPDFFFQGAGAGGGGGAHLTYDVLRGFGNDKEITTDSSKVEGGENADEYGYVSGVTSDGVTYGQGSLGASTGLTYYNTNGAKYIGWNWKAGGAGVANTTGSIDSTVSVNATAGFSIVTYTGEDNAGDTVGHGLAQAPEMIIVKDLTTAEDWQGYDITGGPTKYIQLNDTGGYATDSTRWNNTAPTATVFSLGTSDKVNDAGDNYVAYCFHSIEGYSKVGSYSGNGDTGGDGPFILTNFRPAYVLIKRTDGGGSWAILNNKSPDHNVINNSLYASDANAETVGAGVTSSIVDFLSNGIKIRGYSSNVNNSSGTYLYIAFAESPFKTSRAR